MSYDVGELYSFREIDGGYALDRYLKRLDPSVTELEIPSQFNGKPVVEIGNGAFANSLNLQKVTMPEGVQRIGADAFVDSQVLRSISLPASLEAIGSYAFSGCEALCEVEFKSYPKFGEWVFRFNTKLPAEIALMGEVRSRDITRPLDNTLLRKNVELAINAPNYVPWFCCSEIFSLAAANDCFREVDAGLLEMLLEYSANHNKTELTAYFLELKKRKFGFKEFGEDDDLEL